MPKMSIVSRLYEGDADYPRLRALLTDIYRLGGPPVHCTVGDLDWWLALDPDGPTVARLWFEAEEGDGQACRPASDPASGMRRDGLVAAAWVEEDEVTLFVHPGHVDLQGEMLEWAEAFLRSHLAGGEGTPPATPAGPRVIGATCYDSDLAGQSLLEGRGYTRSETYFHLHQRDLRLALPALPVPPGYILRACCGEEEIEERVAVHRDAFAPSSRMTADKYRIVRRGLTFRPDLDLVAVASDGALAAFTTVWFDEVNRLGVFEPLGTHSAHRRRGLARALLGEGMRRLRALGATTALVASSPKSAGGTALYDSAGLKATWRDYRWEKSLES